MRPHLTIGVAICVLFGPACDESLLLRTLEDFLVPVLDPHDDLEVLTTESDAGDTLVLGESITAGLRNLWSS